MRVDAGWLVIVAMVIQRKRRGCATDSSVGVSHGAIEGEPVPLTTPIVLAGLAAALLLTALASIRRSFGQSLS